MQRAIPWGNPNLTKVVCVQNHLSSFSNQCVRLRNQYERLENHYAARSSDFVITRMVTYRFGLHSVLLSLLIIISKRNRTVSYQHSFSYVRTAYETSYPLSYAQKLYLASLFNTL